MCASAVNRFTSMTAYGNRSKKSMRSAIQVLRAIANERRFMIVCYLLERELHVAELEVLIGISQSALSQHLARLREDELVSTRREAQCIYYSLAKDKADDLRTIVETLCAVDRKRASAA